MKHFKQKPTNNSEILNESLWLNEHIKLNGKYIYKNRWIIKGINTLKDLTDKYGSFLNIQEIKNKYNLNTNFIELMQIQSCIPKLWKTDIKKINTRIDNQNNTSQSQPNEITININNNNKKLSLIKCKEFYWHIINKKDIITKNMSKWEKILPISQLNHKNWEKIYTMPFKTCRETKIQSLQYRILHLVIQNNEWLHNLTIKSTNICELCNKNQIDNIIHYFITCPNCKTFWISFFNWWHNTTELPKTK